MASASRGVKIVNLPIPPFGDGEIQAITVNAFNFWAVRVHTIRALPLSSIRLTNRPSIYRGQSHSMAQ